MCGNALKFLFEMSYLDRLESLDARKLKNLVQIQRNSCFVVLAIHSAKMISSTRSIVMYTQHGYPLHTKGALRFKNSTTRFMLLSNYRFNLRKKFIRIVACFLQVDKPSNILFHLDEVNLT